jgi:hypothetical protein
MENVLIHLIDENDKPVCYYKAPISEFTTLNAEYKWIFFKPDPVVGLVKDVNDAGLLSIKMTIADIKENLMT